MDPQPPLVHFPVQKCFISPLVGNAPTTKPIQTSLFLVPFFSGLFPHDSSPFSFTSLGLRSLSKDSLPCSYLRSTDVVSLIPPLTGCYTNLSTRPRLEDPGHTVLFEYLPFHLRRTMNQLCILITSRRLGRSLNLLLLL